MADAGKLFYQIISDPEGISGAAWFLFTEPEALTANGQH